MIWVVLILFWIDYIGFAWLVLGCFVVLVIAVIVSFKQLFAISETITEMLNHIGLIDIKRVLMNIAYIL